MNKDTNTQDSAQDAAQTATIETAKNALASYLATLPAVILTGDKMKDTTAFSYAIDCKAIILGLLDPTIMLNAVRKMMETEVNRTSGGRSRWSELTVKGADATEWLLAGMTDAASDGRYSISQTDEKAGRENWKSHRLAPHIGIAKWKAAGRDGEPTEADFIAAAHKARVALEKAKRAATKEVMF